MWNKLILAETVGGLGGTSISAMNKKQTVKNGSIGLSVSELYPTGQVKIDGIRYDARSSLGKIEKGTKVEVTGSHDFELTVRKL